mgnify:CR=1 FL=1
MSLFDLFVWGDAMSILSQILQQMNERGQFRVAVLATSEGLPVATVSTPDDTEAAAAMADEIEKVEKPKKRRRRRRKKRTAAAESAEPAAEPIPSQTPVEPSDADDPVVPPA